MGWPVTINGNTYQDTDFAPYAYTVALPAIVADVAEVAEQVEDNKTTVVSSADSVAANKTAVDIAAAGVAASQLAAGLSATNAATSEANAGTSAGIVAGMRGTSTDSLTIAASGDLSCATQSGKRFYPGTQVRFSSDANPVANNMTGIVKTYSGTSLVVTLQSKNGSGAFSDWSINALGAVVNYPAGQDPGMFVYDRYRNQLDDWRALGVPDRPVSFQRFTDKIYFARDKIWTADVLALLAATSGTFTRASGKTMLDSASRLIEFASDVPAITDIGFRAEGGGTNLCSNPRCEGAVAGSPGTLPTGFSVSGFLSSMMQVLGPATMNDVPGYKVRFSGVPSNTGGGLMLLGAAASATIGDVITDSVFIALAGGSLANVTGFDIRNDGFASGTGFVPNSVLTRVSNTVTLTATAVRGIIRFNFINTTDPVDFTLFIGGPQFEKSPFATSLILPPAGSPAQAARIVDSYASTRRASPVALSKMIRGRTAAGVASTPVQTAWCLDDNSSNNRFYVYRDTARVMHVRSIVGGVSAADLLLGTLADNTDFAIALRATNNNIAASLNGGAVVRNASAAIPTSLTYDRIGKLNAGHEWFGLIRDNHEFPGLLSDIELQTLSALV